MRMWEPTSEPGASWPALLNQILRRRLGSHFNRCRNTKGRSTAFRQASFTHLRDRYAARQAIFSKVSTAKQKLATSISTPPSPSMGRRSSCVHFIASMNATEMRFSHWQSCSQANRGLGLLHGEGTAPLRRRSSSAPAASDRYWYRRRARRVPFSSNLNLPKYAQRLDCPHGSAVHASGVGAFA